MFLTLFFIIYKVIGALDMNFMEALNVIISDRHSQMFVWNDWISTQNFWKQFLSGVFIVVVMTGLDQDMMQKNLTCKSLKDAQKDMCSYGFAFLPTNILFMGLGILLITFFQHKNIPLPTSPDELMLYPIANGILGSGVEILFTIGVVAACFSSADSALTSLTTSVCVDICEQPQNEQLRKSSERERALKKELDETRRMRGQLEREKKQFNEKRKQMLAKAQADAESMKRSLRVEGEAIIKQLKAQFSETNKDKRLSAINAARKGISNVHVPEAPVNDDRKTLSIDAVAVGQVVYVTSLRSLGTVLSIKGNRVTVDINGLSATVKVNELQSTTREESNKIQRDNLKAQPKTRKKAGGSAVQRQKEVRTEINILGQTVDEAVVSVGRFIDQALLGGINQVRIIHGKGTGALREGVHQYLRTLPQVAHFETAGYDEGGAGATNVVLK